jgi:hypothetical protein
MSQNISGTFREHKDATDYYITGNKFPYLGLQLHNDMKGSSTGISMLRSNRDGNGNSWSNIINSNDGQLYIENTVGNVVIRAKGVQQNSGKLVIVDDNIYRDKANLKLELSGSLRLRPQTGSANTEDGTVYCDVDGNLYVFIGGKKHALTGLDQLKKDLEAKSKSDNIKLIAIVVLVLALSGTCIYMCKK